MLVDSQMLVPMSHLHWYSQLQGAHHCHLAKMFDGLRRLSRSPATTIAADENQRLRSRMPKLMSGLLDLAEMVLHGTVNPRLWCPSLFLS